MSKRKQSIKKRAILRWQLISLITVVVCVALGLKAEDLRRRRLLFQTWALEFAEQEVLADKIRTQTQDEIEECENNISKESWMPGTTDMTLDEWKENLDTRKEKLQEYEKWVAEFSMRKRSCQRAADRPWENPWPLKMPFWPSPPRRE